MKRREPPGGENKRPSRLLPLLLTALGIVTAAAVAALIVLSMTPPDLTDAQALAMLPEGTELLERHELRQGRVRQIEYRYTEEHKYCLVERTERASFRYEKGAWSLDGEAEVLAESEDWSDLAGFWTERTEGPFARYLRLQVTGFDGGALTGQVLYQDPSGSWEGPAEELFPVGEKPDGVLSWRLTGTGFFRYGYLRVDRDGGIYFDNDVCPMEQSDFPTEPPMAAEPAEETPPEEAPADGERLWLVAAAALNVRPAPDPDGEPLGTAAAGTVLAGTGPLSEDGWYPVAYGDGMGYVSGDQVVELTEDMTVGVVTVLAALNVRTGPGTEYDLLDTVDAGVRMVYTGTEGKWYRVVYGGQSAYVSGGYVTAEPITLPEE